MKIEVLGTGCKRCDQLYENVLEASNEFGDAVSVKKIGDISYFAQKGVFMTPGLLINDKVVSVGKLLTPEKIKEIIKENMVMS